ncbi:MAG: phosphodiester glycosidase family protein [Chromatiaceae bacterium]|nr:MAG: phosphodiester glycosidase family protein [Chromatiaceae bacterium]
MSLHRLAARIDRHRARDSGRRRRFRILLASLTLLLSAAAGAADWRLAAIDADVTDGAGLRFNQRTLVRVADGREVRVQLTFFPSPAYRLAVVDLGDDQRARYPTIAAAFAAQSIPAGVNGGFFHPDLRPLGLMIVEGERRNRFESARLLTGVIYSDAQGTHLVRRGRFEDHPGIIALLQSGPFLVEGGRAVRGLAATATARRSFVATDWRGHWVLGTTLTALSLAELAECLTAGVLTDWPVARALNLDGGSSTGFFFAGAPEQEPIRLEPRKRVRNLLGVLPR